MGCYTHPTNSVVFSVGHDPSAGVGLGFSVSINYANKRHLHAVCLPGNAVVVAAEDIRGDTASGGAVQLPSAVLPPSGSIEHLHGVVCHAELRRHIGCVGGKHDFDLAISVIGKRRAVVVKIVTVAGLDSLRLRGGEQTDA